MTSSISNRTPSDIHSTTTTHTGHLADALANPVTDAALLFRAILKSMSDPGTAITLPVMGSPDAGLSAAMFALAQTLFDQEITIYLSSALSNQTAISNLRFHCNCPITAEVGNADFALITPEEALTLLPKLNQGTSDFPDQSATVVIEVSNPTPPCSVTLSGPGINESKSVELPIAPSVVEELIQNARHYPLGYDTILLFQETVIALPRSTKLETDQVTQ